MLLWYFQRVGLTCKVESFYTTGTQKKIDANSADGFCGHCNIVFEAMWCFFPNRLCQEARPSLTEEIIQRSKRKGELDELGKQYIQEKVYNVIEMYKYDWRKRTRQITLLNCICMNRSSTTCLSKKKDFWKKSNLQVYLVVFSVILMYPRIFEKLLPTFHPPSRALMLVEMPLIRLWNNFPRRKDFWLTLGEC